MGMFDYIRTEMPLPSEPKPPADEWFQTKDVPTDQLWLARWVIGADGTLTKLGVKPGDASVLDPTRDEIIHDFHGDIGFGEYDSATGESWYYVARFTEGKCVRIRCSEHTEASR